MTKEQGSGGPGRKETAREKEWLVLAAHWAARSGLVLMSLAFAGVVWLTFSVVVGETPAHIAGAVMVVFLMVLWFLVPRAAMLQGD